MNKNPIIEFNTWMSDAITAEIEEPNAMTLATADKKGIPSARIVLLKGVTQNGFVFFTNYNSRKGRELQENPHAALVFLWKELERQIRIEGNIEKISDEESSSYFSSRPEESQIGAWASAQSSIIKDREELDSTYAELKERFRNIPIPKPEHWGGFILIPQKIEFWQGRPSRLHDRILYTKISEYNWSISRLSP